MERVLSFLLFAGVFYLMMRFGCGAHMVHGHGGHSAEGSGLGASPVDPVCGMEVVPASGYSRMYEGREYRFCARQCLDQFDATPERYIGVKGVGR